MSWRIEGLSPEPFRHLFGASEAVLAQAGVVRVTATSKPGFPCRITLDDAEAGETLLLLHHEDHAVATLYRNGFAIYVRENATAPALFEDALPPVFAGRALTLRAYDADGMLVRAVLIADGDVAGRIEALFAEARVAYLHAHNAAYGCFAAQITRA